MSSRSGEKIKLLSVDELLGVPAGESAVEIEISKIYAFENHPFKVLDDDKMLELTESIEANGVLTPVIVRPDTDGNYEMISGHRRLHAAKLAGLETIPAITREMTDDQAVIAMVDSNLQRDVILPSEKAFAYKMRYEAMKHQGKKSTSPQVGEKCWSDIQLAKEVGESRNQIYRFMRLTELIPELLDLIDKGHVAIITGVDLSYLSRELQNWIYEYICENGILKSYQIIALRHYLQDNPEPSQLEVIKVLNDNLPGVKPNNRVSFSAKTMKKYFPAYFSADEMQDVILKLLEQWKTEWAGEQHEV